MLKQLLSPVLTSLPVLVGFVLIQVAPADPAAVIGGASATPEDLAAIREQMGLDKPVLCQLGLYVWRLLPDRPVCTPGLQFLESTRR